MTDYNKGVEQVLKEHGVNEEVGLNAAEVQERLVQHGKNQLQQKKKDSIIKLILHPLTDIAEIILLIAASISIAMAFWGPEKVRGNFINPLVILSIIVINVVLSVTQHKGSEKALEALSKLNSPHCFVLRDSLKTQIDTVDLVPGDIVLLKTGDLIPADARVVDCHDFVVDEASLTGESEPVKKVSNALDQKDAPLGDQTNMLFSGCLVAGGNARAVILATGMKTQIGKIANYLNQTKKRKTPLQLRLNKLGRVISAIAIIAAVSMLGMGLVQKQDGWDLSMLVITLAVAAVPETLAIIVTLILTQGIRAMVSKNAIIRKLQVVETLGSTSVICSDKTGTLTQNKMSVTRIYAYGHDSVDDEQELNDSQTSLLQSLLIASNVTVQRDQSGKDIIIGDPTESALMRLGIKKGIAVDYLRKQYTRVAEIPFSSARKMMTVIVKSPNGKYLVITKGAYDRIPFVIDHDQKYKMDVIHDSFAYDALRVITLAQKELDYLPSDEELSSVECNLQVRGFVGIIDPPRPEARVAIAQARNAGIRTIMITGDHAATATAIARDLGIISHKEGVITGQELDKMTDEELNGSVEYYSVYARVSPEMKIRIVQAWQNLGEVVSMTGDGVNDAPALKAADVGVSMGIAGTEVAKSASDMILTDDNFSTIVEAVKEGRNVFSNIRKLIYFLVVCNLSEIFIMFFGVLIFRETLTDGSIRWWLPVTPVMLLLVNVLGDGVPGMSLAKEQSDGRIMRRKPFNRAESFFGGGLMQVIIEQSIAFTVVTLLAYYIGAEGNPSGNNNYNHMIGQTMCFLVLGWTSILHVINVRSRKSIFSFGIKQNKQMIYSVVAMLVVFTALVTIPGLNTIFGMTQNLGWQNWIITIVLSLVPTIVAEYSKFWDNYRYKVSEKNRVEQRKIV